VPATSAFFTSIRLCFARDIVTPESVNSPNYCFQVVVSIFSPFLTYPAVIQSVSNFPPPLLPIDCSGKVINEEFFLAHLHDFSEKVPSPYWKPVLSSLFFPTVRSTVKACGFYSYNSLLPSTPNFFSFSDLTGRALNFFIFFSRRQTQEPFRRAQPFPCTSFNCPVYTSGLLNLLPFCVSPTAVTLPLVHIQLPTKGWGPDYDLQLRALSEK